MSARDEASRPLTKDEQKLVRQADRWQRDISRHMLQIDGAVQMQRTMLGSLAKPEWLPMLKHSSIMNAAVAKSAAAFVAANAPQHSVLAQLRDFNRLQLGPVISHLELTRAMMPAGFPTDFSKFVEGSLGAQLVGVAGQLAAVRHAVEEAERAALDQDDEVAAAAEASLEEISTWFSEQTLVLAQALKMTPLELGKGLAWSLAVAGFLVESFGPSPSRGHNPQALQFVIAILLLISARAHSIRKA